MLFSRIRHGNNLFREERQLLCSNSINKSTDSALWMALYFQKSFKGWFTYSIWAWWPYGTSLGVNVRAPVDTMPSISDLLSCAANCTPQQSLWKTILCFLAIQSTKIWCSFNTVLSSTLHQVSIFNHTPSVPASCHSSCTNSTDPLTLDSIT